MRIKTSEPVEKTSFNFPATLMKAFRQRCVYVDISQSQGVIEAVTAFTKEILATGDKLYAEALRNNIRAFLTASKSGISKEAADAVSGQLIGNAEDVARASDSRTPPPRVKGKAGKKNSNRNLEEAETTGTARFLISQLIQNGVPCNKPLDFTSNHRDPEALHIYVGSKIV